MPRMIGSGLARREREILEVLYREGKASVGDVLAHLPHPPSYSAVRSLLRILEEKGLVRHEQEGKRYLYTPTQPRGAAARNALKGVVQNFFSGSLERAVRSFLSDSEAAVSEEELARMVELIESARNSKGGQS